MDSLLVFVALEVERASLVDREGAVGPTIRKTTVQTTISARDGQTIVVRGLLEPIKDGHGPTIIALTPRVVAQISVTFTPNANTKANGTIQPFSSGGPAPKEF
jgi:hypothetical protein